MTDSVSLEEFAVECAGRAKTIRSDRNNRGLPSGSEIAVETSDSRPFLTEMPTVSSPPPPKRYTSRVTEPRFHSVPVIIPPIRPDDLEEAPKSLWDRITDATSLGLAWSVLIHTILLIAMAVIILPSVGTGEVVAIVATDADDAVTTFDNLIDVSFDSAAAEAAESQEAVEIVPDEADIPLPVNTLVEKKAVESKAEGAGSGKTAGEGQGAPRLRAPANAVRRGRFAAWTIPIKQPGFPDPKPGDSPRPGQSYNIVIQLQLPENVTRYSAGDLTGSVVGTDGYRLRLPNRTYFYNEDGNLIEANSRRRLPIVENTVQIFVHVPAAKYEAVKDTIRVESRRLAESQVLELVFEGEGRRRRRF